MSGKCISVIAIESELRVGSGKFRYRGYVDMAIVRAAPDPFDYIMDEIRMAEDSLKLQAEEDVKKQTGGNPCQS